MNAQVHSNRHVTVGRDVINSIINLGDHSQFFVGDYERLRDAYIEPWSVFERVNLDHFVGRERLLDEVDAFLHNHDRGYFILEAEAGLGKTTFLAWLVRERGYIHHFVELAPGLDSVGQSLKNLAAQLVLTYHLKFYEAEGVLPSSAARPDYLSRLLRLAADQRQNMEKVVLVVDALDEAGTPYGQNVLGLPQVLPEGVFVIVSQRPVPVTLQVDPASTPRRTFSLSADSDANQVDIRKFLDGAATWPGVVQALKESGYTASQFVTTLLEKCGGVWVYLHYVVHEIERGDRSPLDLNVLPDGLTQYYAHYWQRWRDEDETRWDELYLPLLATLATAKEAITVEYLTEWAGVKTLTPQVQRLMKERWRPFLAVAAEKGQLRYRFYHTTLRDFFDGQVVRERLTTTEKALIDELAEATCKAHRRISDWYLALWGGLEAGLPKLETAKSDTSRDSGLRYLADHLVQGGQQGLLYRLVENQKWATAKPLVTTKAIWYLADLALAFQAAVEEDIDLVVSAMGYALRRWLVQTKMANPQPKSVVFLAELGQFDWALELTDLRPHLRDRVQILEEIAQALSDKNPQNALLALDKLAHADENTDGLLSRCVCRCRSARKMVGLGLSLDRAKALLNEAQVMALSLPEPEFYQFQVNWLWPTSALVHGLDEVLDLANCLPVLERCEELRKIAQLLPIDHSERQALARRAFESAQAIEEKEQALEQQVLCLMTLAESQADEEQVKTIDQLVATLDELSVRSPSARVTQRRAVEKLAEVDLGSARLYLEQERWPGAFDAWSTVVSETAKVDIDEALALLHKRLANWAVYPLVLIDIIEQIATEDLARAEDLIKTNAKRLERHLDSAYLAVARACLAQGNQEQAKQIFYQPVFFVDEEHNIHDQAEMQLAMFTNAADLLAPDAARDWFEKIRRCPRCGREDERIKARTVLVEVAARHERHDMLDRYTQSEEDREWAAAVLAEQVGIAKAEEYINQHRLRTTTRHGVKAYAYIAEFRANQDPDALNELIEHYELDPPHDFCYTMMELPLILDRLAQLDPSPAVAVADIINRMWASIIVWECPKKANEKAHRLLGTRCVCYSRREEVLAQLIRTMAQIDRGHAHELLQALPSSPAKAFALTHLVSLGQTDEMSIASAKGAVAASFQDPYERAAAYYELAAALPEHMEARARGLISEADPLLNEKLVHHGITVSDLKELKAKTLINFIQQPPTPEQLDEVLSIAKNVGAFDNKHAICASLFQRSGEWTPEARICLLRRVLQVAMNDSLAGIRAVVAAAVPMVHSLGSHTLLDRLLRYVDWAYQ